MSGSTTDPEVAQAAQLSFPDAYAAAGLPVQAFPAFNAQFGQESSSGKADPANPLQVTSATAANPGYGLPAMNPKDLTDSSKGQQNLTYGLKYAAALAKAKGYDLTTPDGVANTLTDYNGGGDPKYLQHVSARLPSGSIQTAMNGASDVDNPGVGAAPSQATAAAADPTNGPVQAPSVTYTPPPIPAGLQSRLNDNSGLFHSQRSRQFLAIASGLLSGSGAGAGNFGAGLGRAAGNLAQERDQDDDLQLKVYQAQNQQAQEALLAQRYGGQLQLGAAKTNIAAGVLAEKTGHDAGTLALGGAKLVEKTGHDAADAANGAGRVANGAGQVQNSHDKNVITSQVQGAAPPAPVTSAASLPPPPSGVGAAGLSLPGGAPPTYAATGTTPPPGIPQPAAQPAPQQPPQPGPAGLPPGALQPRPQVPQQAPQAPAGVPSGAPPVSPTGQPPQSPQQAPTGALPPPPAGIGASSFAPAGSVYDGLQGGLLARRQTQNRVQASNHKENEGDTAIIEGFNGADALATSQEALLAKVQAQNPGITGTGLIARAQQYLENNLNDPLVQEVQKNASQLTAANYPHGVGALRIPELKVAADQAAGMNQNIVAGTHLLEQQKATRAQMREILTARQNFIAGHPQEDPTISFDPVATGYLNQHSPYTEGPNGIIPSAPGLAAYDQAHTNPQTGRFDPNYEAAAAGARAFPAPAPAAQAASAPPSSAAPAPAAQATSNPLAASIRARLQDPTFRQKALQLKGQAWVDHYSQ